MSFCAAESWRFYVKRKKIYSPNFIIGLVITGAMLLLILIGFVHTPYDITKMDSAAKLAAPSFKHLSLIHI